MENQLKSKIIGQEEAVSKLLKQLEETELV